MIKFIKRLKEAIYFLGTIAMLLAILFLNRKEDEEEEI